MARTFTRLLLMFLFCSIAYAQSSTPQPAGTPQNSGDSSSQQAQPSLPPSSPDSSMPQAPPDKKESVVKRKLKELSPGCLNVGGTPQMPVVEARFLTNNIGGCLT
jgi:hypothetical protein